MNQEISSTFKALGDPTRCRIMAMLAENEMSIGEVAERFEMTRAAVKKHLTVLERGRLISVRTHGRERINRINPAGLKSASDWINHFDRFWDERLARLTSAIETHERQENHD